MAIESSARKITSQSWREQPAGNRQSRLFVTEGTSATGDSSSIVIRKIQTGAGGIVGREIWTRHNVIQYAQKRRGELKPVLPGTDRALAEEIAARGLPPLADLSRARRSVAAQRI